MFTGLVVEVGTLTEEPAPSQRGGRILTLGHSAELGERLDVGASLAVSGVCLTLIESSPERSVVELSPETLARTTLDRLGRGARVNLEPALRMGDPLGGHWVQGHVDGTSEVIGREDLTDHRVLRFSLPGEMAAYVVEKGSITVDGVSLTVSASPPGAFEVALIPHTLDVTTLGERLPGERVNLEVDVLAKYVERALAARGLGAPQESGRPGQSEPESGEEP